MAAHPEPPLCSFAATGSSLAVQACFICRDCQDGTETKCCCQACASNCHKDHDVVHIGYCKCYCDCGAGGCCDPSLVSASGAAANHLLRPSSCSRSSLGASDLEGLDLSTRAFRFEGFADEFPGALRTECCQLAEISKDTFWLPSGVALGRARTPRNLMEAVAAEVFKYHIAGVPSSSWDEETSGAEFWTQVKRFELSGGVDLHYDKDEELAEVFGLGIFPQISTVTYLDEPGTSSGQHCFSPTIIFPNKITDAVGAVMTSAVISHPASCKHIAFDGRLLHGAPAHPGLRRSQGEAGRAALSSPLRVTFLVNIWLNHRPSNVAELGADTAAKALTTPQFTAEGLSGMRIVPAPAAATAEVRKFGERIRLPFLSQTATWGKEEGETGLLLSMCIPEAKGLSGCSDSDTADTWLLHFGPGKGKTAFLVHEEEEQHRRRVRKRPSAARGALKRPASAKTQLSKKRKGR